MGLWRDIFGPGQDEAWGALAKQIGADYTPGGWAKAGRIDLRKDGYIITLDVYTVSTGKSSTSYTRMRSPFRNTRGMAMNIYRKSILTGLGKLMGMQDITVGDALFDDHFVVQGSPEPAIVAFLQDAKIRGLIESQPAYASVLFKIKKDDGWFARHYPDGIDELYFLRAGLIKDEQQLKQMFELFTASVDRLSQAGCAFDVHQTPK
ncbi:MAG TPA: hypothetical protein VGH80_09585 [Xanthomonadaceae bacterium]|jgi:hypothetical protein